MLYLNTIEDTWFNPMSCLLKPTLPLHFSGDWSLWRVIQNFLSFDKKQIRAKIFDYPKWLIWIGLIRWKISALFKKGLAMICYHVSHEQFPRGRMLTLAQLAKDSGVQRITCSDHFKSIEICAIGEERRINE